MSSGVEETRSDVDGPSPQGVVSNIDSLDQLFLGLEFEVSGILVWLMNLVHFNFILGIEFDDFFLCQVIVQVEDIQVVELAWFLSFDGRKNSVL